MIRRSTAILAVLAVGAGASLFVVKHQVGVLEDRLTTLNRAILEDQKTVHVLKAEWSYLNRPERLEDLGRRLLGLEPLVGERTVAERGLAAGEAVPWPVAIRDRGVAR